MQKLYEKHKTHGLELDRPIAVDIDDDLSSIMMCVFERERERERERELRSYQVNMNVEKLPSEYEPLFITKRL